MNKVLWMPDEDDPHEGSGAISWMAVLIALAFGLIAVLWR
jgi:hypothetical protein